VVLDLGDKVFWDLPQEGSLFIKDLNLPAAEKTPFGFKLQFVSRFKIGKYLPRGQGRNFDIFSLSRFGDKDFGVIGHNLRVGERGEFVKSQPQLYQTLRVCKPLDCLTTVLSTS